MDTLYACVIVVTTFVFASGTDCPDRWVAYSGSCYRFGHDNMHFTEAEEYCRHHNAHLVEVETTAENSFLKDYMADLKYGDSFWIGMTDEDAEGIWKWYHSGTSVQFTDWGPTEPQNTPGEDCAVFNLGRGFQWADLWCTYPSKALCEFKPAESSEIVG